MQLQKKEWVFCPKILSQVSRDRVFKITEMGGILNSRLMGGIMRWAVDQERQSRHDVLSALRMTRPRPKQNKQSQLAKQAHDLKAVWGYR